MGLTIISWATHTVNVVTGCSKPAAVPEYIQIEGIAPKWREPNTSPECFRCYAENLSLKRGWTEQPWTECNAEANVRIRPERIREIRAIPVKDPSLPPSQRNRIFICSMGDIFHDLVPDAFLRQLWDTLVLTPHIIMLLTKRPDRAARWPGPWPNHIWLGTTNGHRVTKWRTDALRDSGAKTRFVSAEPLLTSLADLNIDGIDQVIVGGESGAGFRPMNMEWARELRDKCETEKTAYFFKQDAAFRTETRCYLVEKDGVCKQYRQFPGELSDPIIVKPDNPQWHRERYGLTKTAA